MELQTLPVNFNSALDRLEILSNIPLYNIYVAHLLVCIYDFWALTWICYFIYLTFLTELEYLQVKDKGSLNWNYMNLYIHTVGLRYY